MSLSAKKRKRDWGHDVLVEFTEHDAFVIVDGMRVAQRGRPDTPQARTWVSLEPGWKVIDGPGLRIIVIEHNGIRVH